jgi:hypothetical protein
MRRTARGVPGRPRPTTSLPAKKPRSELRHWSTYNSAGEYWDDYRGYVPLPMMVGISSVMRTHGMTFQEAFAALLRAGAIVHVDPEDESSTPIEPADDEA